MLKEKNVSKKFIKRAVIIITIIILLFAYNSIYKKQEVEALSKYGSRGQEVITIQTKLKRWGYYTRCSRWNIWF